VACLSFTYCSNGPTKFIADIRGARVRDLEEKRINKEMANIRKKFKGAWTIAQARQSTFTKASTHRGQFGWLPEEKVSESRMS
jgi:hypothetical protein